MNERLERLLEQAVKHKMTPAEIWDQRVSFVYGQLMDCSGDITREEVERRATEKYGPRPEDLSSDVMCTRCKWTGMRDVFYANKGCPTCGHDRAETWP